jgi:hypothetical protein
MTRRRRKKNTTKPIKIFVCGRRRRGRRMKKTKYKAIRVMKNTQQLKF